MKPPRDLTATEVAWRDAEARGKGRRVHPPSCALYDETDVTLHGAKIAAGHNPAGVTVAQVGAGWRLLAPEEIAPPDSREYTEGIQRWIVPNWDGSKWRGTDATGTFRTAKPPGFFLPAAAAKVAVDIESGYKSAAPDARRYVHTFVCNACCRTCTMETVTVVLGPLVPGSFDMQCPFRRPEFVSLWKAGPVQTLT